MEDIHEDVVFVDEAAACHAVWEVVIGPSFVVNANELVDLNLMDDLESVEDEKIPNAIIEVNASIQHAKIVLANLSQLDIFALEVFLEDLVECLGAVLGDDGVFV